MSKKRPILPILRAAAERSEYTRCSPLFCNNLRIQTASTKDSCKIQARIAIDVVETMKAFSSAVMSGTSRNLPFSRLCYWASPPRRDSRASMPTKESSADSSQRLPAPHPKHQGTQGTQRTGAVEDVTDRAWH